ncbi:ferrous iron transport protein B [Streptomyces gamaensis]|uniref:Ferrous iron transport protein B n=1 Tax=Streptomyces gamaensis TaxID=1763542 RepID=A0ABW0Z3A9_9ACTN
MAKACCATADSDHPLPGAADGGQPPVVALVGSPNVGKSTLFNALTGARARVGNWPGTTVHVARGTWRPSGHTGVGLLDLPGTCSLVPRSPDEALTRDLLLDPQAAGRPELVVVTADAANLARGLCLFAEVRETGVPCLVALTMTDVAAARGIEIDTGALADLLGVPVVPVVPRRRQGLDGLGEAVCRALAEERAGLAATAAVDDTAGGGPAVDVPTADDPAAGDATAEDADIARAEARFAWAHEVLARVRTRRGAGAQTLSDRVDRVLTSPWLGGPFFLAVMWLVFTATTTLAKPLQDGLTAFFSGPVASGAGSVLGTAHAPDWLSGLVVDGLISGVGQLLSFVPLMGIMFVLMAVLEDCGYLARAAFLVDRLMRRLGLPGRAFLPIVVGFGCNVPALSAVRVLPNRRHRLLVGMLIPYASCSARLTVYVLMASVFFGSAAGTVVFALYVLSVLLVVGVGMLLRHTLFRELRGESLVLELPPYRLPTVRVVGTQTWQRLLAFLKTAGGVVVATVTAVWLCAAVPVGTAPGTGFGAAPVEHSALGAASRAVAPLFAPAGFDDWHAAAALGTGFVAKEAVVSTMAQTYGTDAPENPSPEGGLSTSLRETFDHASGGHPLPAVLAFLVFLLAYTPCMTTIATQWQEIGGRLTLTATVLQVMVAWLLAVAVFRIGGLWW